MTYKDSLIERISWLIKLRWVAAAGVIFTVYFAQGILGLSLLVLPLYITAFVLGFYNLIFSFILFRVNKSSSYSPRLANIIANIQISLDLTCLALLIHFSGGVENPFIFYFIFHMIIASILLSRRASFLQATYTVSMFLLIAVLEYIGVLPHYCLKEFIPYSLHNSLLYIAGVSFVFISTLYIAVYMATSVANTLRERERSLKEANKLLQEKDRIKSEYVLRVTHDIKEDLSAIQSCIEPVVEGITGTLNDSQKNLLRRAEERSSKLIFFVNALLEITKIKLTQRLKMETFSLAELIKDVSENIAPRAKSKNIKFEVNIQASVEKMKGVWVYIHEAIWNILANSVKYTPNDGEINLEASEKKDLILIQIKDTGIGIPKNELPYVFDEFYRASNARRVERQGTGLGLSIAKKIIELHKGRIWVTSKEGEGTIFYIELPR